MISLIGPDATVNDVLLATRELSARLDAMYDAGRLSELIDPHALLAGLAADWPTPATTPWPRPRLGQLYWPVVGAARYAFATYLVDEFTVASLRAQMTAEGSNEVTVRFTDQEAALPAETPRDVPMLFLASRPLVRTTDDALTVEDDGAVVDAWVVLLVDARYSLLTSTLSAIDETSWATVFAAGGVTVTDAVDSDYLVPDAARWTDERVTGRSLAWLMDIAAGMVGSRIVTVPGGGQFLQRPTATHRTTLETAHIVYTAENRHTGGGPVEEADVQFGWPETITCVFGAPGEAAPVTVDLTPVGVEWGASLLTTWVDAAAATSGGNRSNLTAQWATDWLDWQTGQYDTLYAGLVAAVASGFLWAVEWYHSAETATTRYARSPHWYGALAAPRTSYVPALATESSWKQPVRVAATGPGTLATDFANGDSVDGETLATGDSILLPYQAAPAENGIYVVQTSGAPLRRSDADSAADLLGAGVAVTEGVFNKDTVWLCTADATIVVDTDPLPWVLVGPRGFVVQVTSVWNGTTGYDWERLVQTDVAYAPASPTVTGQYARTTDLNVDLEIGDIGWLEPASGPSGRGWTLIVAAGDALVEGCGIEIVDGVVSVLPSDLAGDGLEVASGGGVSGCELTVAPGCHILVNAFGVNVDVDSLVASAQGLEIVEGALPEDCDTIGVATGCGLKIDSLGAVALDLSGVALEGLAWDDELCVLTPVLGCGLELQAVMGLDTIAVDYAQLAGDAAETALVVYGNTPCDNLAVDLNVASSTTEYLVTDAVIALVGGAIRLTQTKTTYTNDFNAAGLIINRSEGIAVVTYSEVDPCILTDCCSASTLTVVADADPASGASPLAVSLTATPTGGTAPYTYFWAVSTGTLDDATSATPTWTITDGGTATATVIVTDSCGQTASDSDTSDVTVEGGCECEVYTTSDEDTLEGGPDTWTGVTYTLTKTVVEGVWTLEDGVTTWGATDWDGCDCAVFSDPLMVEADITVCCGTTCTGLCEDAVVMALDTPVTGHSDCPQVYNLDTTGITDLYMVITGMTNALGFTMYSGDCATPISYGGINNGCYAFPFGEFGPTLINVSFGESGNGPSSFTVEFTETPCA